MRSAKETSNLHSIKICIPAAALLLVAMPLLATNREKVATRATPTYSGKVPAAVLLDEQKVTVDPSGLVDTVTRHAVKILTHEGKREAEVTEGYEKGGRQVKELHAWLVAPGGFVKTYEKGDVQDLGAYGEELYNDYRLKRIKADNPEIGAVFIYESEVAEKAMTAQDRFLFQVQLPEVESRYSITLPAGWRAIGTILNHDPVTPVVDGNTYTWTLKDLPYRESEEAAPHLYGAAPMLAVDYQPPAGVADPPAFNAWPDVSLWYARIVATQGDISPEMAAKVRQLTAGVKTDSEKIRALAGYVQKIRYVEIAMDLAHNGGFRPHAAPEVFAKGYGDCKDKANLLSAMLKSAGFISYPVVIYSGDRTHVKKDWASPEQFNHMILAVQVSDAVKAPTVMDSPAGRILLFDPTDNLTPLGDLPFYEQGSYALLCAGPKGDILQMPVIAADHNVLSQTIEASLDANGTLTASLVMQSQGQSARRERMQHDVPADQYKAAMERYLAYYSHNATVNKVEAQDAFDEDAFTSRVDFQSQGYGQLMQGRLLVFHPSVTEPSANHFTPAKERRFPVVLNARVYRKQVTVTLPDGFTVDELPSPYQAQTAFAKFNIAFRQQPGKLIVEEELQTEAVTVPASDYAKVKQFFDNVYGANNQSAVLVKK